MSEHVLRILISELTTLRLVCNCGATVELALERILRTPERFECPVCKTPFRKPVGPDSALDRLARAVREVGEIEGVRVEFVLPEPPPARP